MYQRAVTVLVDDYGEVDTTSSRLNASADFTLWHHAIEAISMHRGSSKLTVQQNMSELTSLLPLNNAHECQDQRMSDLSDDICN